MLVNLVAYPHDDDIRGQFNGISGRISKHVVVGYSHEQCMFYWNSCIWFGRRAGWIWGRGGIVGHRDVVWGCHLHLYQWCLNHTILLPCVVPGICFQLWSSWPASARFPATELRGSVRLTASHDVCLFVVGVVGSSVILGRQWKSCGHGVVMGNGEHKIPLLENSASHHGREYRISVGRHILHAGFVHILLSLLTTDNRISLQKGEWTTRGLTGATTFRNMEFSYQMYTQTPLSHLSDELLAILWDVICIVSILLLCFHFPYTFEEWIILYIMRMYNNEIDEGSCNTRSLVNLNLVDLHRC